MAEGPGDGSGSTASGNVNRNKAEADNAEGLSLVEFCVQLDDYTPTVRWCVLIRVIKTQI